MGTGVGVVRGEAVVSGDGVLVVLGAIVVSGDGVGVVLGPIVVDLIVVVIAQIVVSGQLSAPPHDLRVVVATG